MLECLFCKKEIPSCNFCLDCEKYNICQSCEQLVKMLDVKKSYHCYWCRRHLPKEEDKYLCPTCEHIVCEKCTTAEHFDDRKYCNKCSSDLEDGY